MMGENCYEVQYINKQLDVWTNRQTKSKETKGKKKRKGKERNDKNSHGIKDDHNVAL